MSLPPLPEPDDELTYFEHNMTAYGRACWNAAIDLALEEIVKDGHPYGTLERAKLT
jgi:hypothetical protein